MTPGPISSVVPDEVGGAREAVEVLLAAGHRRIGFVNNEEAIPAQALRLAGFRQALEGHGIPFDPAWVVEGYPSAAGGYAGGVALLTARRPAERHLLRHRSDGHGRVPGLP